MKSIKYIINTFMILTGMLMTSVAGASDNSIRAGIMVNPVGTVPHVEYEHLVTDKLGIGARLGSITYTYEDGSYEEDGVGTGAEFILRYYPKGNGHNGFYIGGGVGFWNVAWEYTDPEDTPVADEGTASAANINVNLGWKIPLGTDKVYIDPSIIVGNFFSLSSDDAANLGFYLGGQVGVGFVF